MTESVFIERNIAMFLLYIPFFVLAVFCKLLFWFHVTYRQRASLSTLPGPKWAAITRLWLVKTLASGKSCDIFVDVNRRYGWSTMILL